MLAGTSSVKHHNWPLTKQKQKNKTKKKKKKKKKKKNTHKTKKKNNKKKHTHTHTHCDDIKQRAQWRSEASTQENHKQDQHLYKIQDPRCSSSREIFNGKKFTDKYLTEKSLQTDRQTNTRKYITIYTYIANWHTVYTGGIIRHTSISAKFVRQQHKDEGKTNNTNG